MPTVTIRPVDWMSSYSLLLLYPCWWYLGITELCFIALLCWVLMYCATILFVLYCIMVSFYIALMEVSPYERGNLSPSTIISSWTIINSWTIISSGLEHISLYNFSCLQLNYLCEDQYCWLLTFFLIFKTYRFISC